MSPLSPISPHKFYKLYKFFLLLELCLIMKDLWNLLSNVLVLLFFFFWHKVNNLLFVFLESFNCDSLL